MEKKTAIHCEYYEIEELVNKYIKPEGWVGKSKYDKFYNMSADLESGNDASHEFDVSTEFDDEDDLERIQEYIDGCINEYNYPHTFMTQAFLVRLCQLGYLEPGEYVIRISW